MGLLESGLKVDWAAVCLLPRVAKTFNRTHCPCCGEQVFGTCVNGSVRGCRMPRAFE